jgi:hypothetical protein
MRLSLHELLHHLGQYRLPMHPAFAQCRRGEKMSDDDKCCEVPLIEQLRSIPKDYRTVRAIQWSEDGRETGHQFIPVGFMMHRAADEIERLNALQSSAPASASSAIRAAEDAIDLFLEYRDKYGHTDESAKAAAINEFAEAESEEVRATAPLPAATASSERVIDRMGPTPRTDAFLRAENCVRDNPVAFDWLVGFARSLERELDTLRSETGTQSAVSAIAPLQGTWLATDRRRAFVEGAKWSFYKATKFTMFGSEVDEAEREADARYGEPSAPVENTAKREGGK